MNEAVALTLFPGVMFFAAVMDVFTMTIPNRASLLLALSYPLVALSFGFPAHEILMHISCGVAVLMLGYALFQFGALGGGDAKLAAATALWVGWDNLLAYAVVAALVGGALAGIILALRAEFQLEDRPIPFMGCLGDKSGGIPYAVALGGGGLIIYPFTTVWARLIGLA